MPPLARNAARPEPGPIPAVAGIGLRAPHCRDFLFSRPPLGWVEVHTENYLGAGGLPLYYLEQVRRDYPVSLHGVALSLGSAEPLDRDHLARVKSLVDRLQPALVSEHLSWSSIGGAYLNDLLPLPYDDEALALFAEKVDALQGALGRRVLIENPSSYLRFKRSTVDEAEFLAELARLSGCGLLLDVNNVAVSAHNVGLDRERYLEALAPSTVEEIHLAGHHVRDLGHRVMLIDDHGSAVADHVWKLYAKAIARLGPKPTLIEWDSNLPELPVLVAEAVRADAVLASARNGVPHDSAA